jgi:hypothetical protein
MRCYDNYKLRKVACIAVKVGYSTIQYCIVETAIYATRVRKLKMSGNPKDYRAVASDPTAKYMIAYQHTSQCMGTPNPPKATYTPPTQILRENSVKWTTESYSRS